MWLTWTIQIWLLLEPRVRKGSQVSKQIKSGFAELIFIAPLVRWIYWSLRDKKHLNRHVKLCIATTDITTAFRDRLPRKEFQTKRFWTKLLRCCRTKSHLSGWLQLLCRVYVGVCMCSLVNKQDLSTAADVASVSMSLRVDELAEKYNSSLHVVSITLVLVCFWWHFELLTSK